jgi:hypothetical protein
MKTYIKITIIIFLTLIVINSFIMWTEPAWLKILPFFEETFINPTIDYLIKIVVYVLMAVQLPVLGIFDLFEKFYSFSRIEAIFTISLMSTGLFFVYVGLWRLLLRIKLKRIKL